MAIKVLEDGRIANEFEIGEEPHILKDALVITNQSATITSFTTNLSGTPTNG